ncbi:unnamed protein product [Cochlearia groenlandica]
MPQMDLVRVSTANHLSVAVDGDYYGGSSLAVPFKWESQPGTPRRSTASNSPVSAPLTPPPYYFVSPRKQSTRISSLLSKNRSAPPSPASSSSSSSSSTSFVPSSPLRTPDMYGRNSRKTMLFGSKQYNAESLGCYDSLFKMLLKR